MFAGNRRIRFNINYILTRFLTGALFIFMSYNCQESRDKDLATEKLYELTETLEPVLDLMENALILGNNSDGLQLGVVILKEFTTDPVTFMEETDTPEQETGEEDLITASLRNFVEYFLEEMEHYAAEGADTNIQFPQIEYEAFLGEIPLLGFLGFASVLPEFLNVYSDPVTQDLLSNFTLPLLPLDLRLSHHTPEVPAIDRKVLGLTESDGFTKPHIPPLRWTADGRLGVTSQVGGRNIGLFLLAPEKLDKPFVQSSPGPLSLALDQWDIDIDDFDPERPGFILHANICDPFTKTEQQNPYSCGVGNKDDCYDVTLVASHSKKDFLAGGILHKDERMLGVPITVRVTDPKTPAAKIAEVEYGDTASTEKRVGSIFETLTPADGRLFVARRAFMPLVWKNQSSNRVQFGSYDIVYAVSPEDADPCDVTYWDELQPITHAPYDPRVKDRYAFAMQPFRDPGGAVVPDGVDVKGTYPWMDKEAKMFSMQVGAGHLLPYGNFDSRYPYRCDSANCTNESLRDTDNSKDNMFMIVGAWTQGKMVLLDGLLNDIDYRLRGKDENLLHLNLYQPGTGVGNSGSGEVLVGATRQVGGLRPAVYDDAGNQIGDYNIRNTSMFDSIENRFNYLNKLKPSRFHDVTWNVSSGHQTVEFAFDDYLNPDAFIVSNMVAYFQHKNGHFYRMSGYDGWHQGLRSFNGQVRVQNSATPLAGRWQVPTSGLVREGRMEPVANGGIRGKGVWLNGTNSYIEYDIPNQSRNVKDNDWFVSVFVDARFGDDDKERTVILFPDNSRLDLAGFNQIVLRNGWGNEVVRTELPTSIEAKTWSHIALLVKADKNNSDIRQLTIYYNGMEVETWNGSEQTTAIDPNNFRPVAGKLSVGKPVLFGNSFHGWVDEFKLFAYEPSPELVCNFGHGTIVGLPDAYNGEWQETANLYANSTHENITQELSAYGQTTYSKYACYHDYSADDQAHLFNLPEGTVSLRESFNFPEGPLYFNAPRPDSSHNEFCLSCHNDDNVTPGLKLGALTLNTDYPAMFDSRRQPTQPPVKVSGNIPADWFDGAPDFAFDTGPNGAYIDEWVLANADDSYPEIRNLALVDAEGDAVEGIYSGDSLSSGAILAEFPKIRVNVNGLVRSVEIDINGTVHYDDSVPFEIDSHLLRDGTNYIEVDATDDRGRIISSAFTFKVGEWAWTASGSQGGADGSGFNDANQFSDNPPDITTVQLRGASWLDHVSFSYADGTVLSHGGHGGFSYTMNLVSDEYISSVTVCADNLGFFERMITGITRLASYVQVRTNHGRSLSAGTIRNSCEVYQAPPGQKITGWHGASGAFVDRLGVVYTEQ